MPISAAGKALIRLGVVALFTAACAAVWELLALQAPGTPLYLGVLPGPIEALRELATTLGLLLVGAGLTQSWARGRADALLLMMLCAGTLLALGAQVYGASHGMYGVQANDLRPDAMPLFIVKHSGLLLFVLALLEHGRRLLFRAPPEPTSSLRDQAIAKGRALDPRPVGGPSARQLDPRGHGN
jgi:hypothetical protein